MPNSWFQFKQFKVEQDQCAMKVCTDACLFGSQLPVDANVRTVLDIGTGTGLLSLMYAQLNQDATIDAVELDVAAASQAAENALSSPWSNRITIHQTAIQEFEPNRTYDLIISNPPFFENDLQSNDAQRNLALHSTALSLEELFSISKQLVKASGQICVLLPYHRREAAMTIAAANDLFCVQETTVHQTTKHAAFRIMLHFATQPIQRKAMTIYFKNGQDYTKEFIALLKPFYLYL